MQSNPLGLLVNCCLPHLLRHVSLMSPPFSQVCCSLLRLLALVSPSHAISLCFTFGSTPFPSLYSCPFHLLQLHVHCKLMLFCYLHLVRCILHYRESMAFRF